MGVKGRNYFINHYHKIVIDRIDIRAEIRNWEM